MIETKKLVKIANHIREKYRNDFWDKNKREEAFNNLLNDLSVMFNKEKPKLIVNSNLNDGEFGYTLPNEKIIVINKYSLITLLHEAYHYFFNEIDETNVRIASILTFVLAYPEKIMNNEYVIRDFGIFKLIKKGG